MKERQVMLVDLVCSFINWMRTARRGKNSPLGLFVQMTHKSDTLKILYINPLSKLTT